MNKTIARLHHRLAAIALAACAFGLGAAHAGTVQITVTDKDGKPAADVVVLVDSASKPAPQTASAPVLIVQEGSRFVPYLTVVATGSTVRFVNRDGYDHHVRSLPSGPLGSTPPVKDFELRLDAPAGAAPVDEYKTAPRKRSGTTQADVVVDKPGAVTLGCHLHASMRGHLYASPTPWFAKTDADGIARIDGVPDGSAELRLWHPDQLQDQPALRVQVGTATVKTEGQLNFSPRRRRS